MKNSPTLEIIPPAIPPRENLKFPCYAKDRDSLQLVYFFDERTGVEIRGALGSVSTNPQFGDFRPIYDDCWEIPPAGTIFQFTQP